MCYFIEPVHCSAPNIADKIYAINSAQHENWEILSNSLRAAMEAELTRRRDMGATSLVVTLRDIGVTWSPRYRVFSEYPGLASLHAIRPEWFDRNGDTRVTTILWHIASDPSF